MNRSPHEESFPPPEVLAWLDRLPVAAVWTDGDRLVPNARTAQLVGWPRDALTTIDAWFERLYGDRADAHRAAYARHRETGFPERIDVDTFAQDGTPRFLEISAVRDAIGEVWLLRDRAAEVETAAAARDLAQTVQALGHHVPGVLYQFRMWPDGRSCFPFATRGIRDIYGVDPEAVREDATPVFEALHPDDLPRVAASIETSRREMSVWRGTYRVELPGGRTIWAQGEATPEAKEDGSVLWHGYISDVTAERERQALWSHAVRSAGYDVWSYDPASTAFEVRSGANRVFGPAAGDGAAVDLEATILDEDHPALHAALAQAATGDGADVDARVRVRTRDGTAWIRLLGGPEAGPGSRVLGLAQNVDEDVRRAERARRLADIVGQAPSIVMLTDLDGRIEYVNRAFERVSGYVADEVIGLASGAMGDGTATNVDAEPLGEVLARGEAWSGEFVNRAKDGSRYVERAVVSPLRDKSGRVTHYVKLAEDMTAQRRMAERVAYLSERDELTGLPNRSTFLRRLAAAVAAARRHGDRLAVFAIDVDAFSIVNDRFGHEAGDGLLRSIAERLQGALRKEDVLARIGGDGFALLLDRITDVDDVAHVVDRLRRIASDPFEIGDDRIQISFGIGVAVFPSDAADAEALTAHAEAALYRAREAGPGEVAYYTEAMNERLHERVRIDAALREGLAAGELRLVYQPRVDMPSGRIVSLEALARWTSPRLGEVSPGRFIPVAEGSGFIGEVGRWVVRAAVARIAAFRDAGLPLVPVAVNLSARHLREPDVVTSIADTLADFDVPPGLFEVEITESAVTADVDDVVAKVRALERLGVAVSIDDFGTAYSSLGRLKRLGVQSLKIDQSFVRDLGDDPEAAPNDAAIVRAVIALGEALGLAVIAEGVETPAQRDFLLRHGCRIAQGYLFARPVEVEAVEAMLRAGRTPPTSR